MIPIAKPFLEEIEARSAFETILSGWVTQGPKVEEFERLFSDRAGALDAVAVSSCTAALHLALIVAGIGPGDEVICPSMSFIATANAIRYINATPVFGDIDPLTYNLDVRKAEALVTSKTRAILLVHQMGMPADIDAFKMLCRRRKLTLIEDAACAVGSRYKEQPIGSHSELVCFSFHPRKIITTGDGGMIATSNREYAERLRQLRQHGMSVNDRIRHAAKKPVFETYDELGYNYRMTDIQAAVGIQQLNKLDWIVTERRRIAAVYRKELKGLRFLRMVDEPPGCYSNYQSFPVYVHPDCPLSRDQIMAEMLDRGIATRRGIMTAHREPAYGGADIPASLKMTEQMADRSLLLPLFVPMEDRDLEKIISTLLDLLTF
jgi:perosamine synthetase